MKSRNNALTCDDGTDHPNFVSSFVGVLKMLTTAVKIVTVSRRVYMYRVYI